RRTSPAGERVGGRAVRVAARVGEADRGLDRLALEVSGPRELRRLRGRGEGARADRPLRMNRAAAGVGTAIEGLDRVDDLLPEGGGGHGLRLAIRQSGRAMDQAFLIYDPDCGFCRWCLGKVLAWDRHRTLRPVALG